ncbi:hypothetical protein JCGZ_11656 [Jatropha curcas]|uniref:Uncharacterized protein n=1 Tax=Jatropha curcas TaxID=180498 RepID=A0A067KGA8_JATCU|nr:hypothetical protein JCGZ_11656 [Jatropha curcas]
MLLEELIPANTITTSRILQQHLFHLLQSCKTLKYLSQIHTQIVIHGFSQKSYILAKLLSFYIASGHLLSAHKVFKEVKNPSVTLWNQMIRGHARSESPRKSVILFNQMRAAEAEPNLLTYSFLLSGCARSGLLREGEQVHGRVLVNGYYPNVFMKTNLINLYGMAGADFGVEYAQRVFDEMGERNIVCWNSMLAVYMRCGNVEGARRIFDKMMERNVVTWTTMIAGYARNGKCRQALILFNKMRRAHVDLDQVSLVAALSACAELGDLRLGRWIHTYIEEKLSGKSQSLLISLNNALIHMYASCGVIEEAYEVFRWMPKRSNISWTTMICAFAKQGYANEALAIFELMQSLGANEAKPDEITFIGVLSACSHAGLVNKGCQLFMSMIQSWGINPGIEHYGCMVDLLSRAGLLDEANDIIKTMPMKPNEAIWGALLGGCRIHKNYTLACYVAQKLVAELDPDQAAGYLMLLADVHATAKMWQDVATVKQKMIEMGVKKPSGRSRVQINGVVDDFVAGDRNHKHASPIYNMLALINRQVYKPEKWQAFSIVDDE